ncbi:MULTISPECIES: hypothetical protein [Methylorubrum]|uniref:hypothetical protein n=1 Tax=Methylorubrum TaxID=2282523 RepID=UPI00209CD313|nr:MULTISPECIES: hypothetical protein [Methylorubrum]MCP1550652.1 hypothetical protein [Methylorubrum zatmanii]MCP1552735.1 hypothetical protein [Methylorubrum extorquens]MCP1580955.1 hypothetical protein [Methylorubrum extorquens]
MSMTPTTEEAKTKGQEPTTSADHAPNNAPSFWRCPDCCCHSYAHVHEQKQDGSFGPGPKIRCVNCKALWPDPALAAPRADSALGTLAVPDGWLLVPEEVTGAMWSAGQEADTHPGNGYSAVWRAMVEAATAPPVLCSPAPPSVPDSAEGTAGEDRKRIADRLVVDACELPDRTSPEDQPEMLLITGEELHGFLMQAMEEATPAPSSPGVPDSVRNFAAEDLARIRAAIPASLLFEVPDLAEAVASTFQQYVKVAAEATGLRKQAADLRTALGEPFLTAHAGDEGGSFIRLKYKALSEAQAAHNALVQFFAAHPAGQSTGQGAEAIGTAIPLRALSIAEEQWGIRWVANEVEGLSKFLQAAHVNGRLDVEPLVFDGGRFAEWKAADLAAQCRAQALGMMDPDFGRFLSAVADRLTIAPDSTRTGQVETGQDRLISPKMTPEQERRIAHNLCGEFGPDAVIANATFVKAFYDELYAAARQAAPEAQGAWRPKDVRDLREKAAQVLAACEIDQEVDLAQTGAQRPHYEAIDAIMKVLGLPAPPASSGQEGA